MTATGGPLRNAAPGRSPAAALPIEAKLRALSRATAPAWARAFWCALSATVAVIGLGTAVAGIVALFQGTAIAVVSVPPMAALGWIAGIAAMRIPGSGAMITSQEVMITGPLRTWHVPLSEAEAFVAGARGNQPTVPLTRTGDRSIGIDDGGSGADVDLAAMLRINGPSSN